MFLFSSQKLSQAARRHAGDISALISSLRVSYTDQGLLASRDTCTWLPLSVYRMSVSLCLLYLSPTESIALISSRAVQSGALVPPILHSLNLHNTSIIVVSGQITRYPLDATARPDKVAAGESFELVPPSGYLPRLTSLIGLPARPRDSDGSSLLRVEDGTTALVYVRGVALLDPFAWFVHAVRDFEFGTALAVVSHTMVALAESVAASLAPLLATA